MGDGIKDMYESAELRSTRLRVNLKNYFDPVAKGRLAEGLINASLELESINGTKARNKYVQEFFKSISDQAKIGRNSYIDDYPYIEPGSRNPLRYAIEELEESKTLEDSNLVELQEIVVAGRNYVANLQAVQDLRLQIQKKLNP